MPHIGKVGLVAISWLGALLRLRALFANSFHADEALFASWARQIAVWRDPLLLTQPVDKPPLLFYLQALFYPMMGPEEWAARLPNLIASILLIPLVGILAWRFYRQPAAALLAALLVAAAPLAIQFSATAFTDPLLTFWLMAALFVVAGRSGVGQTATWQAVLGGVLFGLAVSTKHQGWLFLPLLLAFVWQSGWSRRNVVAWLGGVGAVLALLILWSLARGGAADLWTVQLANAGGVRLAWSWELLPRLVAWGTLFWLSLGWPFVVALLAALPFVGASAFRGTGRAATDAILLSFSFAYATFHWLTAVPVWDRYLLPLLPLLAILTARGLSLAWTWVGRSNAIWTSRSAAWRVTASGAVGVLSLGFLFAAWPARNGQLPLGGTPAADHGAAATAELLGDAPYGTVLYDHFYSWHWRYQLFDSRVYVNWFPDAAALADDLHVFGALGDRFLVLPDDAAAGPIVRQVRAAGYDLEGVEADGSSVTRDGTGMRLYRIVVGGEGGS